MVFVNTGLDGSLAAAREAFLAGQPPPEGVIRDDVLKSWRRSALVGAAPDTPTLPFWEEFEHGRLSRAAVPVLDRFASQLDSTSTTLILADAHSRIIRRWTGERSLSAALDRSQAVPGVSLAEEYCGTNGIGSVTEERRAVCILGSEHWRNNFTTFTCAGAPVTHPVTRQLQGVVTLCCRVEDSNRLMLPLVKNIATEIEGRLHADSSRRERVLLDRFLTVSRSSRRPIVVLNDRVIMSNTSAARILDRADHAVLWQQATEVLSSGREHTTDLVLTSGATVTSRVSPVHHDRHLIGAVVELVDARAVLAPSGFAPASPGRLPGWSGQGLTGRSRAWREVVDLASRYRSSGAPVLISGEAGVGKLALAAAAFGGGSGSASLTVLDAALHPTLGTASWLGTARRRLANAEGTVVLAHIDLVEPAAAHALCSLLDEAAGRRGPRIVATITTASNSMGARPQGPLQQRFIGLQVDIPPLRERREDITALAETFAASAAGDARRWHSEALQALVRWDWPGNVRQLKAVVDGALAARPHGDLRLDDLPPQLRSAPRRMLSKLEKMELDAIVSALAQSNGNKSDAAELLGISRSTMYRKIRAFGLDLERAAL